MLAVRKKIECRLKSVGGGRKQAEPLVPDSELCFSSEHGLYGESRVSLPMIWGSCRQVNG